MSKIRISGALALCAIAVATLAVGVRAYSLSAYKWAVSPVVVYLNPTNMDVTASAAETAVRSALNTWSTQSGSAFRYQYGGRVADTNRALDGRNVVIFRNASSGGALASTYSWTSGGSRVDSDIVFWDASYKFFTGTSGCSSGAYIEDVATHELGHSLGLGHSKLVDATMYSSYTLCSTSMRTPAADDLKGLQLLYPGTGGSVTNTAPSVTIASPANGATVTAGASTSFSGSASDSQQGNLTSQLVWRSNLSGQIGTGGSFTRALTAGTHTITATVTDSGGLTTQRSITVYAAAASSATAATLTATARTSKTGVRSTGLVWSGLISPKVDIYRNGAKIATKTNDGTASDAVPSKGTYTYKLCAQGTATCTNQASVTF